MTDSSPLTVKISGPTLLKDALGVLLDRLPGFAQWDEDESKPDIILVLATILDNFRDQNILDQHPHGRVLLLSISWTPETAMQALQAGVSGILTADLSPSDLAAAFRQAVRGEIVLSAELQKAIVLQMAGKPKDTPNISLDILSEREQEVLSMICQGFSNKHIAQKLYLSVRTVENHLRRLYQKLGVSSRTEAVVLAMQNNWVKLD